MIHDIFPCYKATVRPLIGKFANLPEHVLSMKEPMLHI